MGLGWIVQYLYELIFIVMKTTRIKKIQELLHEHLDKTKVKIISINSTNDPRLQELERIAAEFFGTETDENQIPATPEATKHSLDSGGILVIAIDDENNPVGWASSIPTTKDLMNQFLNESINEAQLFWQSNGGEYDAIYFISVFIKPEFRSFITAKNLIMGAIQPLLKSDTVVFYDAFSNEGAVMGNYLKRMFGDRIISK